MTTAAPAAPKTPAAPGDKPGGAAPDPKAGAATPPAPGATPAGAKPGEAAAKPAESAIDKAMRKYKLKIDGQEIEKEFSDEQIQANLQKALAADKRMEEHHKMRMSMEQFLDALKKDPVAVLQHPMLGHDFRKLAEEYLWKIIEDQNLDPKERELRQTREELRKRDEVEKTRVEKENQTRQAELRKSYSQEYEKDIMSALEASGLPKTPHTVKRIAHYLHEGLVLGRNLKAADVVPLVQEDYQNEIKHILGATNGDILSLVGEEVARKIREADLARMKVGGANPPPPANSDGANPGSGEGSAKKVSITKDQFREKMEKIKKGEL